MPPKYIEMAGMFCFFLLRATLHGMAEHTEPSRALFLASQVRPELTKEQRASRDKSTARIVEGRGGSWRACPVAPDQNPTKWRGKIS